jgi:NADPH:quinone reductase-like Zn-dependent oxidoreductase
VRLTALVSIEDTLQLARGETILIQGGAGGVAGFAIQLAKHMGARVITTASAANHAYVRSLGADEVIDYRTEDFTQKVSGCDAVFDTVGGGGGAEVVCCLATGRSRRVQLHRVSRHLPHRDLTFEGPARGLDAIAHISSVSLSWCYRARCVLPRSHAIRCRKLRWPTR